MDLQRVRTLRDGVWTSGPVVYWMDRDQRVTDNWALLYAQELARARRVPLGVVFVLPRRVPEATARQYDFMLRGLEQVGRRLAHYRIPFFLLAGSPENEMAAFVADQRVGTLVTDFSPLRTHRHWRAGVAARISIPFHEVDAHNVIPCWIASPKREYAAATFRPKVQRLLPTFLEEIPALAPQSVPWEERRSTDWTGVRRHVEMDTSVCPVEWLAPGEEAAHKVLHQFKEQKLEAYGTGRNDPTEDVQSNLSPYLHFGHIAAQRVALALMKSKRHTRSRDAFLEELIVRRELSDNFCFYTPAYDSVDAFPAWAKMSLDRHRGDRRDYIYTRARFERARTHDPLWNAAQREMTITGKMHGYMRMYWAKKILEWTPTPEDAVRIAVYLNDKYHLDGHDPNGYTGIAWSIGGVHDRAWGERNIFGKIRSMSYEGCRRKFDVDRYIANSQRM